MLFLKILSLVSFVAMIVMNYLANTLPIGGNTTGDVSGEYQSLFTPSGFTFSIWGIIYLLLGIFLVLLFVNPSDTLSKNASSILILLTVVNVLNILWLLSWHHKQFLLSIIVMVGLLVALLMMVGLVAKSDRIAYASFSVYAGWISVALIANITVWIVKEDFSIFTNHEYFCFFLILGVSLFIGLFMVIKEKNYYYGSVFLWAYIGIATKFL